LLGPCGTFCLLFPAYAKVTKESLDYRL